MKPICRKCNLFFRPKKNGVYFTESYPTGSGDWKPYKVWQGDLWECRGGCGSQIIVGTGHAPIAVHHEPNFEKLRLDLGANTININDC